MHTTSKLDSIDIISQERLDEEQILSDIQQLLNCRTFLIEMIDCETLCQKLSKVAEGMRNYVDAKKCFMSFHSD